MKNKGTITLETPHLLLRKFALDDYKDMFENWAKDPIVAKQAGFPPHENADSTKKLIEFWINEYADDVFNWVIELKKNNTIIGSITVVEKDLDNKICEIGYTIGQSWWNNGYATEAVKKVLDYLFQTDLFNVITANCHDYNIASQKVLKKNHFVNEGVLRNRKIIDGKSIDLVQFSILKEEFLK